MALISIAGAAGGAERTFEALDAVVRDGAVVLVEPDGRSLRALDLASGTERWRLPLGGPASAAIIHTLGRERLLVQAAGRYTAVDTARGQAVASREAPAEWTFVHRGMGGCALRSSCTLAPVACDDGRPLGPPLRAERTTFLESDEEGRFVDHQDCIGDLEVLAEAGGLVLMLADTSAGPEVSAIDGSGAVRWRSREVGCRSCVPMGAGASADGALCWTTDRLDAGGIVVRAFDCATGTPRFSRRVPTARDAVHGGVLTGWIASPPALLVQVPGHATALSAEGEVRWERALPARTLALPEGLRVPSYPLALDAFGAVARLDPSTGAIVRTEPIPAGRELRIDEAGAIAPVRTGGTSDRGGAYVPAPEVFSFERDRSGSRVLLGDRVALSLPGDGWVIGEHRTASGTWLAVAQPRDGKPDLVHVLRK